MRPRNMGFCVAGGREIMMAEEQLEYLPLAVTVYPGEGDSQLQFASRWTFTPEERERIAAGEDITITMPGGVAPYNLRLLRDQFPEGS